MTPTLNLETLTLKRGMHRSPEEGMCLLEATAYLANEPFTDHPACVCPVLARFGRYWFDGMRTDEERASMRQYVPLLIGTKADAATEELRSWMALDWLVRVHAATWLRVAGIEQHAAALAALPPILNSDLARQAQPTIDAAVAAAGPAVWGVWAARAARAPAGAAGAARAAAGSAGAAGRAAGSAGSAGAAVLHAAAWAAWAAWAAAGARLEPTVIELQASAHDLFHRMIEAQSATEQEGV